MQFFRQIKRFISCFTAFAMLSMVSLPSHAAMVGNQQLLQQAQHQISTQQLVSILERGDIQQQLISLGVDPAAAKARAANMTDMEIAQLNQQLQEMPAGAGAVGIILFLFVLFVVTDLLGATDIFPFVKNINK
jgi:hypothetical protein